MPPKLLTMPQVPQTADWQRVMEAGMQFTELRRSQARTIVEMSRRRREDIRRIVQQEVQRQLGSLGLATKADLTAFERRMTRANREAKKAKAKKAHPKKSEPKKTTTAKKPAPKSASKAG